MRGNIKKFIAIAAQYLPMPSPIYEFGSLQVAGQEGFADLRPIFSGRKYVGADMRKGPGVDVVLNLHRIDLPSKSVGSVICLDTLEHVEYPHQALQEIHQILVPFGIAVISSVMDWPIHDFPYDYWRFTPTAFESLLKPFRQSFVGFVGNDEFPHTVVGIGFKGKAPDLSVFANEYQRWRKRQEYEVVWITRRVVPPILLPFLEWVCLKSGIARYLR